MSSAIFAEALWRVTIWGIQRRSAGWPSHRIPRRALGLAGGQLEE
jgi:hypothetical protein